MADEEATPDTITLRVRDQTGDEMFFKVYIFNFEFKK